MLGSLHTVSDVHFSNRWEIYVIECHIYIGINGNMRN
jgi:hypothetical protein